MNNTTTIVPYSSYRRDEQFQQLRDGPSLQNRSIQDLFLATEYRVVGVIELLNKTDFELTKPQMKTDGGNCSVSPQTSVGPLTREAMVVHKYPGTATGSYGTLSYYIRELNRRVVLMWSLPYNHDFYSNWLAIDIKQNEEFGHSKLFDAMYYGNQGRRTEYHKYIGETKISDGNIAVYASMTTTHQSHIKLKIEKECQAQIEY